MLTMSASVIWSSSRRRLPVGSRGSSRLSRLAIGIPHILVIRQLPVVQAYRQAVYPDCLLVFVINDKMFYGYRFLCSHLALQDRDPSWVFFKLQPIDPSRDSVTNFDIAIG
jgi:hypothetical protein